jgi:hypothetical protein
MAKVEKLADFDHPIVIAAAKKLTRGLDSDREKLKKLFYYVRDDIKFGYPLKGDLMKASETITLGLGQCNTKSALLLALCKAVELPARIHFSLIKKDIQKGIFTGVGFKLLPEFISHSWLEVKIDGKWRRIDSYINDIDLYNVSKQLLNENGWDTGYSIANSNGDSSAEFNIDEEQFVQMGAVTGDHGIWDDPGEYYASKEYQNRPNLIKMFLYRLTIGRLNKKVQNLRNSCIGDACPISGVPN